MKNRLKKRRLYAMTKAFKESRFWRTAEEQAWLSIAPVGREFGSPVYERIEAAKRLASLGGSMPEMKDVPRKRRKNF